MTKATIQSTKYQMPKVAQLNNNLQIPTPICPRIKRSTPNPPNRKLPNHTNKCLLTVFVVVITILLSAFYVAQCLHVILSC